MKIIDKMCVATECLEERTDMVSSGIRELAASTKCNTDVQYNLDMNVIVSKAKKISILKAWTMLILVWILVFLVVMTCYIHINAKIVQLQMGALNYNIARLTHQYDKLSRNVKRRCPCKTTQSNNHKTTSYDFIDKSPDRELFNSLEARNSKSDTYINQASSRTWNQSIDHQDAVIKMNSSINLDPIMTSSMKSENNSVINFNKVRNLRDLQTSKIQNLATIKDKKSDADVMNSQDKTRIKRSPGDMVRPAKRKKRRRNRMQWDPSVATFVGAVPDQHTTFTGAVPEQYITKNSVVVGPWRKSNRSSNPFDFTKFHLADDKMSIEVTIAGLYMISVQIFYYGESKKYSYHVSLKHEGASKTKKLIRCATAACNTGETTCHTSIITYLQKGDRLSVHQRESNILIDLREGYSHIQLTMLAKDERETT